MGLPRPRASFTLPASTTTSALKISRERPLYRRHVASTEEIDVDQQRIELIEIDPFSVSWLERVRLVVAFENGGRETAEELHHSKIDLAVAAVDGRINEARLPARPDQKVATPKVSVKAGAGFVRDDVGKSLIEVPELAQPVARGLAALDGFFHPGLQPLPGIEVDPVFAGRIALGKWADEVVEVKARRGSLKLMHSGQATTQLFFEPALFRCRFQELEGQEASVDRHHLRHAESVRLRQPAQTACFGGKHLSRRFGSSLHEESSLVVENDLVGPANISTCQRPVGANRRSDCLFYVL